ncbi:MAG TPA: hypothetical protein VM925_18095 [Labilithrix sp.]|jgi:hypothetical protein|nr:hypothetical protein [Labilithrix sp.]
MQFVDRARSLLSVALLSLTAVVSASCTQEQGEEPEVERATSELNTAERASKYGMIRDSARAHGIGGTAYLLAAIAFSETGLAHCWSEATWACQGPRSADCGGGPVIAGAGDGPCNIQQGGLGMFQFDAGTFTDTLNRYGNEVLLVDGQVRHVIDYVVNMVRISDYTWDAETDSKALAWINRFDVNNGALRDQWIKTVVRYYNGCLPSWSCWGPRYNHYNQGLDQVLGDTGGTGYWRNGGGGGVTCPGGSGTVVGMIAEKYKALGGCGSVLGRPITDERATPDGKGRYSVFERGSIYWTQATGAFAVLGAIRDAWKELGWEAGFAGYPLTDELTTPDRKGRFNVFQGASIYWTEQTGAHEVHGAIRDKWKELGWEAGITGYPVTDEEPTGDNRGAVSRFERASIYWGPTTGAREVHGAIRDAWEQTGAETGPLGYPTSDEYAITGGRRSDFERGAITWNEASSRVSILSGD